VIWEIPAKKEGGKPTYEAVFIRRDEVDEKNQPKEEKKPHPAAKKLGIIHKNDCIEFVDNGIWYKARIAGYSASQNKLDYRPIYAVTDCNDWIIATSDKMTETCWKQQKGHNFISVNVLFGEKQARIITVNPIGRVYRKKC
jgi:CRISPR-associated endonuclease Csn1